MPSCQGHRPRFVDPVAPLGCFTSATEHQDHDWRKAIEDDVKWESSWTPRVDCRAMFEPAADCSERQVDDVTKYLSVQWDNFDEAAIGSEGQSAYRLIYGALLVRVMHRNGRRWAVVKSTQNYIGTRPVIQVVRRCVLPVSSEQWSVLSRAVGEAGFWEMPAFLPPSNRLLLGYDGPPSAILEVVDAEASRPSRHHLVRRYLAREPGLAHVVDVLVSVARNCCSGAESG